MSRRVVIAAIPEGMSQPVTIAEVPSSLGEETMEILRECMPRFRGWTILERWEKA